MLTLGQKTAIVETAGSYAFSGPSLEGTEFLLKNGAEVNLQGKAETFTDLITATAESHLGVVHLLLTYGLTPDIKDIDSDTSKLLHVTRVIHQP